MNPIWFLSALSYVLLIAVLVYVTFGKRQMSWRGRAILIVGALVVVLVTTTYVEAVTTT